MEKEHETGQKGKDNAKVRVEVQGVLLATAHVLCRDEHEDNDGRFEGHDARGRAGREKGRRDTTRAKRTKRQVPIKEP